MGGGTGSIYAPVFPRWLHAPGFWDDCFLADIRLSRLYTVLILQEGKQAHFRSRIVDWRPDRLIIEHIGDDVRILETRAVLACHAWVSRLELLKSAKGSVDIVVWSLQDYAPKGSGTPWRSIRSADRVKGWLQFELSTAWPEEFEPDRTAVESERLEVASQMGSPLSVFVAIGANALLQNRFVQHTQRHDDSPLWDLCAACGTDPHKFQANAFLPEDTQPGLVHLGQTYTMAAGDSIVVSAGVGLTPEAAVASIEQSFVADPFKVSEKAWKSYFDGVPKFESSDPYLTNAYWYRWYGLRLNTVSIPTLPISGKEGTFAPFVTEGVGFFRNFVTYSAQAHLREAVWMRDPSLAVGIVENLANVQRADGSLPGHSYSCRPSRDFYHADFATGYDLLEATHGSRASRRAAEAFANYLKYFVEQRWAKDRSGFLIFDQNETGQEYMNRYSFANPEADQWQGFRIVGVDATAYMLRMARLVRALGCRYRRQDWIELADLVLLNTKSTAYSRQDKFICDLGEDGQHSPARPATGFYGLSERAFGHSVNDEREIVNRWLVQEGAFRLGYGFAAEATTEPGFSAEGLWKGKRLNCPWNGRSWPMVNSHLVDELASLARLNPDYRNLAGDSLMSCIRMMFHDGDPNRPNSYEHYNPKTGQAALYRGYDDYMHSWIVDLIIRHAVGFQPNSSTFDPLPLPGVEWIECSGIPTVSGPVGANIRQGRVV